ncbi:MAG: hypothetical protein O7J95_09035 [Planctomycetota bacterium]|nr:hypothetical protein [Planctomycetota bacterium]
MRSIAKNRSRNPRRSPLPFSFVLGLVVSLAGAVPLGAQEDGELPEDTEPLFNWDLISLEQNNPRFNGSVLTGFHSVRSPGVTPQGGWKLGLGLLYTHEEQFSNASNASVFDRDQVIFNPKVNYGFLKSFEAGLGVTGGYATGRDLETLADGTLIERGEDNLDLNSVDVGIKWNFLDIHRYRVGLAFDTRIATNRGDFGNLPGTFYNLEIDADVALTSRFSVVGNLQFLTSDSAVIDAQVMGDIAATYTFTDQFRGMLFGTIQEDDEARAALGFVGIAGQFVFEQHSFTLAFDLQLNDARRDLRTEEQLDVELSYTFTF